VRAGPGPHGRADALDVLGSLTSLETYDALAGETRGPGEVTALVDRVARRCLGGPDEQDLGAQATVS